MSISSPEAADLEQQVRQACADLGRRLRGGDECRAEEYFALHPEIVGSTDAALEVIYTEFVVRKELTALFVLVLSRFLVFIRLFAAADRRARADDFRTA